MPSPSSLKRFLKWLSVLLVTALLAACGGRGALLAADPTQDRRIQSEVAARIAQEPSLRAGSIRVEVEGATVVLHGSVSGIGAWQCALTNAGLVEGVRSVVDLLVRERGERDVQCLAPRPESSVIVGEP